MLSLVLSFEEHRTPSHVTDVCRRAPVCSSRLPKNSIRLPPPNPKWIKENKTNKTSNKSAETK